MNPFFKKFTMIASLAVILLSCGKAPKNTVPSNENGLSDDQSFTANSIELKIDNYQESSTGTLKVTQNAWLTVPSKIRTSNLTSHSFTTRIHFNSNQEDISNELSTSAYCEYETQRFAEAEMTKNIFVGCFQKNESLVDEDLGFSPGDIIAQDIGNYLHIEVIEAEGLVSDMFATLLTDWI